MVIDSFNLLAFFETKNVMVVIQISCGVLGVQVCRLRIGHMGSIRRYNGVPPTCDFMGVSQTYGPLHV